MPRTSKKAHFIDKIFENGIARLMEISSDDDSEYEESLSNLENRVIEAFRTSYGQITAIPKQTHWLSDVLPNYDEIRFKQVTRVSHLDFQKIYELIKFNPVFFNKNKRQFPVSVQLAIALYRFGHCGTASSNANIANLFGVGDGSTITRITRRVKAAIMCLKDSFVYWPNEQERNQLADKMKHLMPGCIGWMDGTPIDLEEAPAMDSESFYDKNKNYSIQVQLICDIHKRIRHYIVGYPGSVHDSRVWNDCEISKNSSAYMKEDQYLSADKGYPLTKHVMVPFRENSRDVTKRQLKAFNKHYSRLRVIIEHVNGGLKEMFASLKELRVKICDRNSYKEAIEWVESCIILYNIVLPQKDVITELLENDCSSADTDDEYIADFDNAGKRRRIELCHWVNSRL